MPSLFGSSILSHSKRMMNYVIEQLGGFYKNGIYYIGTDSLYRHKEYWSDLVDYGFVGKSLGLGKKYYGNSSILHAWFLASKLKYCLVIDNFGVILAEKLSKH